MSGSPSSMHGEVRALTGVRGVASIWVLFFHAQHHGLWEHVPAEFTTRPLRQIAGLGYLGVDLFFTLSGFILTWTYRERLSGLDARSWLNFLWNRLARVYPVHLTVLGAMLVLAAVSAAAETSLPWSSSRLGSWEFLLHLTLMQSWGLGLPLSWNQPAWSVSAEWFAYLWFPLFLRAVVRIRGAVLPAGIAGAALVTVLAVVPGMWERPTLNAPDAPGLIRAVGECIAGTAACIAVTRLPPLPRLWSVVAAVAGLATIGLAATGRADPWALPAFLMLIAGLTSPAGFVARCLGSPAMVFLGRISYALYLVHWPIFVMADASGDPGALPTLAWISLYVACPLVTAWIVWRFVEEPAREWMRRLRTTERARSA